MTVCTDLAPQAAAIAIGERLAAAYRVIGMRSMRGLPVYNPTLDVAPVGFRRHGEGALGIVVTPWFMNLVAVGDRSDRVPAGSSVQRRFPAGDIAFSVGSVDGIGRVDSASLFSPMFEFDTTDAACAAAETALATLFAPAAARHGVDRRAMLFGGRRRREAKS
jgi:[NiFe] hydrogenase assembly HybE family chaperone